MRRMAWIWLVVVPAGIVLTAAWMAHSTYDGGLTCVRCLHQGHERKLLVAGITVWRTLSYEDMDKSEASAYERITGNPCRHQYVVSGFGILGPGRCADGISFQAVGAHERMQAIGWTYSLFARWGDVELARRTLQAIDMTYPLPAIMAGTITPEQRAQGLNDRLAKASNAPDKGKLPWRTAVETVLGKAARTPATAATQRAE